MESLRKKMLICLVILFVLVILGAAFSVTGSSDTPTGAAIGLPTGAQSPEKVLSCAIPCLFFLGFLILTIVLLERD